MRRLVLLASLSVLTLPSLGCDSILGVAPHQLAPGDGGGTAPSSDATSGGDTSPSGGDEATDAQMDRSPSATDAGPGTDAPVSDGSSTAMDSSPASDGATADGLLDAAGPNEGGPVPPMSCANDSGTCVTGGIFSLGRLPDDAGVGLLPNGSIATVTDDAFEFGETLCDSTGMTCVTGAIAP